IQIITRIFQVDVGHSGTLTLVVRCYRGDCYRSVTFRLQNGVSSHDSQSYPAVEGEGGRQPEHGNADVWGCSEARHGRTPGSERGRSAMILPSGDPCAG